MINSDVYTKEYIQLLTNNIKADRNLVERTLFAFGLLEALVRVEMPFVFKGGTCLLLLLDQPKRLSTDIDIIVESNVDLGEYLKEAEIIFPFKHMEEAIRKGKNNIIKRHFRFFYDSPIQNGETNIILDVVFEHSPYAKIVEKNINNNFLLINNPVLKVCVPSVDCILGDKLTAFAPNTTGIPFGIGKELEIIKQMHDVASLFEVFENIEDVKRTYITTAKMELDFRGLSIDYKECLKDTIKSCLCIMAKNKIKSDDYKLYLTGIRKIRNHMIGYDFNPDIAADQASKVLYLCTCLLTDSKFEKIIDTENYKKVNKLPDKLKSLMYLKRFNIQAFAYFVESMNLYKLEELI